MAVLAILENGASLEGYRKVSAKLNVEINPPHGLIMHAAADVGDGRMKAIDIWESAEDAHSFYTDRLAPAMAEALGPDAPAPDVTEIREIAGLIHP